MSAGAHADAAAESPDVQAARDGVEDVAAEPAKPLVGDKPKLEPNRGWAKLRIEKDGVDTGRDTPSEPEHIPKNGFFSPQDDVYSPRTLAGQNNAEEGRPPPPPEKDLPEEHTIEPTSPEGQSSVSAPGPNGASSYGRDRSESRASSTINGTKRGLPLSSMVFVASALETIAVSKEARRRKELHESVQKALSGIKDTESPDPEVVFEPLRLATETGSIPLTTTALDCISKLITYSYFSIPTTPIEPSSTPETPQMPLIERAIDTICDCFQDEATPAEIQLQIVKSLLAAVLNDKIIVHGAGLLKAVRQIYNIFLLSKSTANQQVAQGTLTQMVGTVFERVKTRLAMKEARLNMSKTASGKATAFSSQADLNGGSAASDTPENDTITELDESSETASVLPSDQSTSKEPGEKLTLQSFENAKNFDDTRIGDNAPTMVTRVKATPRPQRTTSGRHISVNGYEDNADHTVSDEDEEDEIYIKDAFLVFRSMCRLSHKILHQEQLQDIKGQNMRSKLVSLSIIRTLLNNNMEVFTSPLVTIRSSVNNEPATFGHATNQYLRLTVSRNGASAVKQVFETTCEIFWLMLKDMRVMLKVSQGAVGAGLSLIMRSEKSKFS